MRKKEYPPQIGAFTRSNIASNEVSPSPFGCPTVVFGLVSPNITRLMF